jgi:hypothetical protein
MSPSPIATNLIYINPTIEIAVNPLLAISYSEIPQFQLTKIIKKNDKREAQAKFGTN